MHFLGEVRLFAGGIPPAGWAFCDGQLLAITSNVPLFSVLGTTYGGNGTTTFALPDLRGRVAIHPGEGPDLTSRALGESSGSESLTLTGDQLPAHTHAVRASTANGSSASPVGAVPARTPSANPQYAASADTSLAPEAVLGAGGSQPHNNMQPYLVVSYIIAIQGNMPTR